jgi:hypothetical protein
MREKISRTQFILPPGEEHDVSTFSVKRMVVAKQNGLEMPSSVIFNFRQSFAWFCGGPACGECTVII